MGSRDQKLKGRKFKAQRLEQLSTDRGSIGSSIKIVTDAGHQETAHPSQSWNFLIPLMALWNMASGKGLANKIREKTVDAISRH